jgi:O-antigen ligase
VIKEIRKIGIPFLGLFLLYLLNPFGLNIYIGYLLIPLVVIQRGFLMRNLDFSFFVLLLFSLTYAAYFSFEPKAGNQYIVIYALVPPIFYLLGKFFASKLAPNTKSLFYLLLFVGIIFSVSANLSVFTDILRNGYSVVERNLPNFWTGKVVPATIMGSYFSLIMTIPALLIPRVKGLNLIFRIVLLLVFVVTVASVLRIGSRTQLGISIIALLVSLIYVMPRQSFKRNFVMFLFFFLGVFYLSTKISLDLDQDWLSAYANRMEDSGDFASGGGRTDRWAKSLENLFEKPLGWSEHEFGHAHNLWFDVLRIGGVLSFLLLIFFTTSTFITVWKAIRKNSNMYFMNNQIIAYTLAFTTVFTLEPIMEGMFDFFAFFCFFAGTVKSYYTDYPLIE